MPSSLHSLASGRRVETRSLWWVAAGLAIALAFYSSGIVQNAIQGELVNLGGWSLARRFLAASLHPDLSPEFVRLTLEATGVTLAFAVCGTVLSLGLGFVGGILSSEVWWQTLFPTRPALRRLGRGVRLGLAIPRAIHELIWGLLFVNLFGLDPLVGLLAIAIPFGAIVAKVFSDILDETPREPLHALTHSGVSPLTAWLYGLLPQALPNLLSYSFYRFECSLRSAAVLGIIGAGGLGYEIFLSLQSLRYEQLWTLFYALIALNGAVDMASAALRHRLGAPTRLDLNLKSKQVSRQDLLSGASNDLQRQEAVRTSDHSIHSTGMRRPAADWVLIAAAGAIALLIITCFSIINADWGQLASATTWERLGAIAQDILPVQLTRAELQTLARLAGQTLSMSLLAIAIASVGGIGLSFVAAHNFLKPGGLLLPSRRPGSSQESSGITDKLRLWLLVGLSRLFLLLCRAIPAPIWALVCLFILFPGILPGAIALAIHNLGILGRLMAEGVENLNAKPLQALKAQGITAPRVFLYGVLPLCLPRFLAYSLYRWEVCMRETVIVGLVGAGGLGRLLTEQLSSFDYSGVAVSLVCFVILTFGVDWISRQMGRSLR
ncbi:MAG: ABC transporter permease subunit [Elainellaceae cyanobacterium]